MPQALDNGVDSGTDRVITVHEVERLLVREASLLDQWKLKEWLELLTDDARYFVPALDSPDRSHKESIYLIADTRISLQSRVEQLIGKTAWAESPRSRTRRLVTNIDILEDGGDAATIGANFAVWRFQHEQTDVYVGRYEHRIKRVDGALLIQERRAILDLEVLRPHGKLSFIL